MFNRSALIFFILAVISGALVLVLKGPSALEANARESLLLVAEIAPQLVLGLLTAACVSVLVPRDRVAHVLGDKSGFRGIALASLVGALMPGGPFASFPLVYAFFRAGADIGTLVAFLTAWAAISVHRLVVWEIPFMGLEFGSLRLISSLPMPFVAGLLARQLVRRYPTLRLAAGSQS